MRVRYFGNISLQECYDRLIADEGEECESSAYSTHLPPPLTATIQLEIADLAIILMDQTKLLLNASDFWDKIVLYQGGAVGILCYSIYIFYFPAHSINYLKENFKIKKYEAIESLAFYASSKAKPVASVLIFEAFYRQQEAFDFFDSLKINERKLCKIFSYETHGSTSASSPSRRYLVASIDMFMFKYLNFPLQNSSKYVSSRPCPTPSFDKYKHCYEIIRASYPCRAYFDLEFSIPDNPGINGVTLMSQFINLVIWKLYFLFNVSIDRDSVVVIDSTTNEKFSKHITLIIRNNKQEELLFKNNYMVGVLVQSIISDICDIDNSTGKVIPTAKYDALWVNRKDCNGVTSRICFVDLGVYTKNRAFRLLWSSKYGKQKVLTIDPLDKVMYPGISVAGSITDSNSLLSAKKEVLMHSFVMPFNVLDYNENFLEINNEISNSLVIYQPELTKCTNNVTSKIISMSNKASISANTTIITQSNALPSIYPSLDDTVIGYATKYSQSNNVIRISLWSLYITNHKLPRYRLNYQIVGSKYCHNIKREHRSNHIFIEIDLSYGFMYQKCWDVDCKGYNSDPISIDKSILPSHEELQLYHLQNMLSN
jgi:hypothetical protein